MAEECQKKSHECETTNVEATDRGMFDFLGKKEEKEQEAVIVTECEAVYVSESEEKMEEEKPSLIEKLHRSHSSSSSSSDEEEVEEGVEKKKKKKGLKEKISGEKKEEHKDTFVPIEKCDDFAYGDATHPEEKKGFLEKIKDKLPGQHKKPEEVTPAPVLAPAPVECSGGGHAYEGEAKEKKGILEKIKEKLPGHHKCEEEKEKECGTH